MGFTAEHAEHAEGGSDCGGVLVRRVGGCGSSVDVVYGVTRLFGRGG